MGGSWFANKNGEFVMQVTDGCGHVLAEVSLMDLEPEQELYRELPRGRDR